MRRSLLRYIPICFLMCLIIPVLQGIFKIVPEVRVAGATINAERFAWSFSTWFDGSFQENFETWLDEHIGFRGWFIKTDNEINFRIFRYISGSGNTKMILGRENYLFERDYVYIGNTRPRTSIVEIERKVARLKLFQEYAKKKGITVLFIVSPNKARIYAEYLPAVYKDPRFNYEKVTDYDRVLPLLSKYDIDYIDGFEKFFTYRKDKSDQVFLKTGTHWSSYGACLFTVDLIREIELKSKKDLTDISCDPAMVDRNPYKADRDLADLMNVWSKKTLNGITPHPTIQVLQEGKTKPSMFVVGDSFMWTVLAVMDRVSLYKERDFLYYYFRNARYPENVSLELNKEMINWEKDIFSKDIILIEASETALEQIGFGFLEDAEKYIHAQ